MSGSGATGERRGFKALRGRPDLSKLLAMMGLSFLVLLVVGILRPVRSAIALAGLEPGDFYQVYFVSAIVVLVVPIYNRLADRISWQRLIPATAMFFAASMVIFRLAYLPGVGWYGLLFYGWYDLLVASLITQFFMATQIFYNARDAKRAYPIVIAAGSTGAALGGATSYLLADRIGAPNMLPLAAVIIFAFGIGIAVVWAREAPKIEPAPGPAADDELVAGDFKRVFSHPQVRLIAITVLLTVLVKQFVDYEYNTLIREVFIDVDEIARFLGLIDALTQWLPILVLLSLRPILRRWGAGVTVLIFPVAVILATGALALSVWLAAGALAVAVGARTTEKMFRYSAERTGREILYVPVPEDIKLKAKAYVDVGIEKGVGKVLSGAILAVTALVFASVSVSGRLVIVGFMGLGLAVLLLIVFLRVRREYVASLARSFEGRFASLQGTFVSMADSGALDLARDALKDDNHLKVAFALELLKGADVDDLAELSDDLHDLLDHPDPEVRIETLGLLKRLAGGPDEALVGLRLADESARVRQAAVSTLAFAGAREPADVLAESLASADPRVRAAALACMADDFETSDIAATVTPHFERLLTAWDAGSGDTEQAVELARASAVVGPHERATAVLRELMAHADSEVASTAVLASARREGDELVPDVIEALATPQTRGAGRAGLASRGRDVVGPLVTALNDPTRDPWVRRGAAAVLGEIPAQVTLDALIDSYFLPETEQALDDQALTSLHRIKSTRSELEFPDVRVLEAVDREVEAATRYGRAAEQVGRLPASPARELLAATLREARADRRASVFRWLGLIYPENGMRRSHLAVAGAGERQRANAVEWVESTVGHTVFLRLGPILRDQTDAKEDADGGDVLRTLWDDEDVWIARCALWAAAEAPDSSGADLASFVSTDPALEELATRLRRRLPNGEEQTMDLIEKVFLLQNVDLLSGVSSRQLALLASIARDIDTKDGAVLIHKGEPPDALYIVIHGEVSLAGVGESVVSRSDGQAFGTWAFIDDQPSLVEARTVRPTRVLRILREDFRDLLVDHPELGLDLLRGLARRVRALAAG